MAHRLSVMFEARSMAVIGASARPGSFGARLAAATVSRDFQGRIDFINPRGGEILGHPALGHISELDHAPDVAILGVGATNLEQALLDAIDKGARSAVIFDSCQGKTADGTLLLQRLKDIACEADLPVCGGSGMGFISTRSGAVASFYPSDQLKPGGISLIAHSGSVFTVLGMNDPRYRFDLMTSPGQEIGATIDEYIAYAASRETTRVIAVFMEAARNPAGLVASLQAARDRSIPVVICKVGRTEESARLARSHTGAIVGANSAYDAVFEEYGAIVVASVDEMMNTALLCSTGRFPGPGGAGLVTDSGGLREMQVDLAVETGTPLARLSETTRLALRAALPPELEPSNPLDCAADLTDEFPRVFQRGLAILAAAPEVSMLGFEVDLRDDYVYEEGLLSHARALASLTDKPCFFYSSFAQTHNRALGAELAELGVPCLNGAEITLAAIRNVQHWADGRHATVAEHVGQADPARVGHWRARLAQPMDEHSSLALLADFGVPAVTSILCRSVRELDEAAKALGFPLVLKTAQTGVDHKSDLGGVFLDLRDELSLHSAYADLTERLGPRAIVQAMIGKGVELAFGCVVDPDFGPLVMVSAGGTLIEVFDQRRFALAPFGPIRAEAIIRQLSVARLIDGVRGQAPRNMRAAALALSRFSIACAALAGHLIEIDVNPVVVTETDATAVDALIVRSSVLEASGA